MVAFHKFYVCRIDRYLPQGRINRKPPTVHMALIPGVIEESLKPGRIDNSIDHAGWNVQRAGKSGKQQCVPLALCFAAIQHIQCGKNINRLLFDIFLDPVND